jgi:bifunctional non-homologous end joining protein LigD
MPRNQTKKKHTAAAGLDEYEAKRSFDKTPEPEPEKKRSKAGQIFVVQKHRASHLHYDFRLEADGVLKSWAVPKGPSLNPQDKRLAMAVEDHPLDYAGFEGVIPEGEYGGGTVMVWDRGTYVPDDETRDVPNAIDQGELKFTLKGKKLKGSWVLVRTSRDRQWLLIKQRGAFASEKPVTEEEPRSVLSGRTLAEIARDEGGDVAKAATGDPAPAPRSKAKQRPQRGGENMRRAAPRKRQALPKSSKSSPKSSAQDFEVPAGARAAAMPKSVQPMLATLVDKPFSNPAWIYEIKWDGVRTLCYLQDGKHRLASRRQNDVTGKYPELSHIPSVIAARQAIFDGEIVALDREGAPRFQLLQHRFGMKAGSGAQKQAGEATIVYYIFDLIYLDGYDLAGVDLLHRKELLHSIIGKDLVIRYSDHIVGDGKEFFAQVQKRQLEGMMAKRSASLYTQKRSKDWLKVKTIQRQEVVIGGYTEPRGSREYFGALVVGLYDGGHLKYVGHAGGGFDHRSLKQLYDAMQPLKTKKSPFSTTIKTNEPVQWIQPALVCEVKFAEWTDDGNMRQPIFMGLREDKDPKDSVLEKREPTEEVV